MGASLLSNCFCHRNSRDLCFVTFFRFRQSAECLRDEAKLSNDRVICDNINLETIIIEYESFYFHRFKKYPQISKTTSINECNVKSRNFISNVEPDKKCAKPSISAEKSLEISGDSLLKAETIDNLNEASNKCSETDYNRDFYSSTIAQCMCHKNRNVRWDDIKGLEHEKELLKEAIIYPIKYPHLFQGPVESWKSMLLYGPPGTGKSLLAATIANESGATFFNITASSIISKWRGDTEKLIKVLFGMADQYAPSIIFIDEFDSFASKRNAVDHEASRRMKSEIFLKIDDLIHSKKKVFFLAATNCPWDLEESVLRRFEKQIYIAPPDEKTRELLLQCYLPKVISDCPRIEARVDFHYIAQLMRNYSGCDIKNVCKEIKMQQIRRILRKLESNGSDKKLLTNVKINTDDIEAELMNFKPTILNLEKKYTEWKIKHVQRNSI